MAATQPAGRQERSILDTPLARLMALAIAIGIGALIYTTWQDDIRILLAGDTPTLPMVEATATPAPENPALAACLEQRIGDVEQMRSDGIIDEAQYTTFRQRAEDLCRAQNPAN